MKIKTFSGDPETIEIAYNEFVQHHDVKFTQSSTVLSGDETTGRRLILTLVAYYDEKKENTQFDKTEGDL